MARFTLLFSLISALFTTPLVHGVPLNGTTDTFSPAARDILLSSREVTAAPRWVAYFDKWISDTSMPTVSDLSGFNVFALAFIFSSSYTDNAAVWAGLPAATRSSIKAEYAAAGISLVVSAFGSTYLPTSLGNDPTAAANYIANYVISFGLDGVDVDYEDFAAVETAGTAVAWLTTFTKALRAQLPQGQYILTHAPVAPWFSPGLWAGNAYLGVDSAVGSLIDWYNIQFYNQGASEYTTCAGLLTTSSNTWPQSAVFQIAANGVSLNKLVIGKPATTGDATTGYMDPATLSTCLVQAAAQGWSAGAMTWQYPNGGSAWITQVRSGAFAVGSTTTAKTTSTTTTSTTKTTSTATTTTTSTTTSTPTGTGCSGVAAWSSSVAYSAGSTATYSGSLWTATEWNDDEAPGSAAGAWSKTATC
ncbi:glycoside hydrolase [Mycena sanguinolenta]|nr:glycoside hydrolase [Mycena sanguinolenta]